MANVIFFMLPEKGHINASLKLAKTIKSRGHEVYYLQLLEYEEYICSQGLKFIPLFESLFPKTDWSYRHLSTAENLLLRMKEKADAVGATGRAFFSEELRNKFRTVEAPVLIQDVHTEMLAVPLAIEIPRVMLNTTIIPRPVPGVPTLVLCPQEFALPEAEKTVDDHYVEASIDLRRKETPLPCNHVDADQPLIYCSLGTQSHWTESSLPYESNQCLRKNFLQTVINVVAERVDCRLIMSLGRDLRARDFHHVPTNALLVNDAPQIELLKRASLTITHGGLNTVKECIFFGVPMIVFPLVGDQFQNADRVVYHQLGLRGEIETASEESVSALIATLEGAQIIRTKMKMMKELFRKRENEERALSIIESTLISAIAP